MRLPHWLLTESDAWRRDGLITEAQRRAILARYDPAAPGSTSDQTSSALTWLAVILAGIGTTVLVAWNWASIPASVKILLSAGPMLGLYAASAIASRSGRGVRAERLALLAALFAGAVLFVTEDLVHNDPQRTNTMLLWAAVLAATALLTPSALTASVGIAVLGWWVLIAAGSPTALWWFPVVWLLLALSVERDHNRWVASGVTLVFGVWIFVVVSSIWTRQPTLPAIAAVLAGSWIDTLARGPDGRRPAFARTTPALGLTLLGSIFLMVSGSHRTLSDWRVAAGSIWPALALTAGLLTSTGWHAWKNGAWKSRPVGMAALAAVWLIVWLTLPVSLRTNSWLQWTWTMAFSAAVILMGASAVRAASRTRDRGQFALGLVSVVAFVVVRVLDARSLVMSGLMLLASALVLWWLGRMWAGAAAKGGAA